jgi:hypothetical protein
MGPYCPTDSIDDPLDAAHEVFPSRLLAACRVRDVTGEQ